jgi:hypothetical protein
MPKLRSERQEQKVVKVGDVAVGGHTLRIKPRLNSLTMRILLRLAFIAVGVRRSLAFSLLR